MSMRRAAGVMLALAGCVLAGCAKHGSTAAPPEATTSDWPSYGGTGYAWRYSALDQINTGNVKQLVAVWLFQSGDYVNALQSTPIVVDGVMYLSTAEAQVFALDAATGAVRWHYRYPLKVGAGVQANARGVAVGEEFVYLGTWDNHMVAIDRRSGREVWKVALGAGNCLDCAISAAPLLVKNLVITGQGGGDAGSRGYLTALDAQTGRLVWRFYMIPGPGESGHDSWQGESWKTGGGAPWGTGSYDPALGLIYWSTGNPTPALSAATRDPGSADAREVNLYTSGLVALDADTGKLRWHYSLVPKDVWDYDAVAELVLIDHSVDGRPRQLLVHAGKTGVATVLDRTDGTFVRAFKFAELITWMDGIGEHGEILGRHEPKPGSTTNLCPGPGGSKNWTQMAYSPRTGSLYVPIIETCADYMADSNPASIGGGEGTQVGFGGSTKDIMPVGLAPYGHMDAFGLDSGQRSWKYSPETFLAASVLATAGDLVFSGDAFGEFFALDARSGAKLWRFATGAGHRGSAITYSVRGRQYIATPTGFPTLLGGKLRNFTGGKAEFRNGSTLVVFALPERF